MLYYLKRYPLSLLTIILILYLSFFNPPQTDIQELPDIDKLVHICMYGGLCILLWFEYLSCHRTINSFRMLIGAILLPVTFSGIIELAQAYATENRSGDWLDFIANISGIIIASFLGYYVLRPLIWKNKRNASDSHEQPTQ